MSNKGDFLSQSPRQKSRILEQVSFHFHFIYWLFQIFTHYIFSVPTNSKGYNSLRGQCLFKTKYALMVLFQINRSTESYLSLYKYIKLYKR